MIISHSKKFVFFRIPKTGSSTAQTILRMSNAFDLKRDLLTATTQWFLSNCNVPHSKRHGNLVNAHCTPAIAIEEGVLTLEQLHEYNCFAFCRDVHSRFVSAYVHANGTKAVQPSTFLKKIQSERGNAMFDHLLGRPQVDYFFHEGVQVVTPLDFKNYAPEIQKVLRLLGANYFEEIPKLNVTALGPDYEKKEITKWAERLWNVDHVRGYVKHRFADDREFYLNNFVRGAKWNSSAA